MDDVNEIIHLSNQMGLIDTKLQGYYPNASNCLTRTAVEETNIRQYKSRSVLKIEHISGMLLILPIGLGGALLVFTAEFMVYKFCSKEDPLEGEMSQQGIVSRDDETKNQGVIDGRNVEHNQTAIGY